MKKLLIASLLAAMLPLSAMARDTQLELPLSNVIEMGKAQKVGVTLKGEYAKVEH